MADEVRIAVLVPCYNEEITMSKVIANFRAALPHANISVHDNNSTDRSIERAQEVGAIVRRERLQGKGNVIKRMFADVEADAYVLVDGDDTYDAASAPGLIACLLDQQLDMVNAARVTEAKGAYRPGQRLGNVMLSGTDAPDAVRGIRAYSREAASYLNVV